jgi:2-keto-3-deoxy-L-rhamnonate aldolase RhmA
VRAVKKILESLGVGSIAPNRFLQGLHGDRRQLGLWASLGSINAVEVLACASPDWILFDLEHTASTIGDAANACRVCENCGVELLVRPPSSDPAVVKRLLDCGVRTLLLPQIRSATEAFNAITAARYPPAGIRGVASSTRNTKWGNHREHLRELGDQVAIILQIETSEAVRELEEILRLPGLDGIFVGPADLAANLGHLGDTLHAEVIEAQQSIRNAAARVGIPAGLFTTQIKDALSALQEGFSFVAVAQDAALLLSSAKAVLSALRPAADSDGPLG